MLSAAETSGRAGAGTFYSALRSAEEASSSSGTAEATDNVTLSQPAQAASSDPLKEAFQDFVGQTFFSQMIKALRSTEQGSAYMNGGRAEKIFKGQFDQVLSEQLSDASAEKLAEPMFELFMLPRQS